MNGWLRYVYFAAVIGTFCSATVSNVSGASPETDSFFRIGTGGIGGTYFQIGSLIARGLTKPNSDERCEPGKHCGIPGIVAVAQISNGSISNINSLAVGELDAALVQADTAYWAQQGTEVFESSGRVSNLRAIAALYPESLHVVVRRDSGIQSVRDLRGKRVSLDEPGSGTLIDSRILLKAFGLTERDLKPEYIKPNLSAEKMAAGKLDAFLIFAGYPTPTIRDLTTSIAISLLPVSGREVENVTRNNGFLRKGLIPKGTYHLAGDIPTLQVMALLVVSTDSSEDLIEEVTRSLWSERTTQLLKSGHPKGRLIRLGSAFSGVSIPFHPGTIRFYRDIGLNPDDRANGQ